MTTLKRRWCFTLGHTSGYRPSLQIPISVLLIFLLSVYNRDILLIILIILILDRRQSVGYSERYFLFLSSDFIYLFMLVPTYLKSTNNMTPAPPASDLVVIHVSALEAALKRLDITGITAAQLLDAVKEEERNRSKLPPAPSGLKRTGALAWAPHPH